MAKGKKLRRKDPCKLCLSGREGTQLAPHECISGFPETTSACATCAREAQERKPGHLATPRGNAGDSKLGKGRKRKREANLHFATEGGEVHSGKVGGSVITDHGRRFDWINA